MRDERIWVTQAGEEVPVREMTDAHLRKAIFYLHGRLMQARRGRAANEREQAATSPGELWPRYYWLVEEADRRHLSWRFPDVV